MSNSSWIKCASAIFGFLDHCPIKASQAASGGFVYMQVLLEHYPWVCETNMQLQFPACMLSVALCAQAPC